MSQPRFITIGNSESPRTVAFAGAVLEACGKLPTLISWKDVMAGRVDWTSLRGPETFVRIDSPGRNFAVEKKLLALGADVEDEDDALAGRWTRWGRRVCEALEEDRGRILPSRQGYLGFRKALSLIETGLDDGSKHTKWFNSPTDIARMCDKQACNELLSVSACPVPAQLGLPEGFDHLMELMKHFGHQRVFLKLCHGSSASGAVALEMSGGRIQAFCTTQMVGTDSRRGLRMYNSRKVLRYTRLDDLRVLIDALCAERALAEAWVPKAGFRGARFDVRVVVVSGRSRQMVARLAGGPFTNLQLGSTRASETDLELHFGGEMVKKLRVAAEDAVRCFHSPLYAGVDVAWELGRGGARVLEVNAFGDLLPGVYHEGEDTYKAEVLATLRRAASAREPRCSA